METTLHRQLKALYAGEQSQQEVTIDGYRIDAVAEGRLIEIQQGSLGAIRDKVRDLLDRHDLLVVKPVAVRTYLVKRTRRKGRVESARYSPSRGTVFHVFDDLVHFVNVFPHPRLTLSVLLTEQEEHRIPAPKRRWRSKGFRVEDRFIRSVGEELSLRTPADLLAMLPAELSAPFTTADLAEAANIPRWLAQKAGYCLRKTGAATTVGKRGNAWLYAPQPHHDSCAAA